MDPWYLVTLAGEPLLWGSTVWIVLLAYLLLRGRFPPGKRKVLRRLTYVYIPGVLASLLLVLALKEVIIVPRPCIPCSQGIEACNPYCGTDNSFPSGHAAGVFAVATSLFLGLRKKGVIPFYAFSVLVALSRLFLGVHTVVDIAGGMAIGIVVPFAFSLIYKKKLESR